MRTIIYSGKSGWWLELVIDSRLKVQTSAVETSAKAGFKVQGLVNYDPLSSLYLEIVEKALDFLLN
jgi:hypothetical protein